MTIRRGRDQTWESDRSGIRFQSGHSPGGLKIIIEVSGSFAWA